MRKGSALPQHHQQSSQGNPKEEDVLLQSRYVLKPFPDIRKSRCTIAADHSTTFLGSPHGIAKGIPQLSLATRAYQTVEVPSLVLEFVAFVFNSRSAFGAQIGMRVGQIFGQPLGGFQGLLDVPSGFKVGQLLQKQLESFCIVMFSLLKIHGKQLQSVHSPTTQGNPTSRSAPCRLILIKSLR